MDAITRRWIMVGLRVSPAVAQYWAPGGTITVVAPFAMGGATDVLARLNTRLLIRNVPGEGGQSAAAEAAHSPPGGLTLLVADIAVLAFNPHLFTRLGNDLLRDFAPIGAIGVNLMVLLASQASGIVDLAELRLRVEQGRLSMASAGHCSALDMVARRLMQALGGSGESLPHPGVGPAMEDLQVRLLDVLVGHAISAVPTTQQGICARAVFGPRRLPKIANVPMAAELGLGTPDMDVLNMLLATTDTPLHVIHALAEALEAALGNEMMDSSTNCVLAPSALIAGEYARWGAYIRQAGIEREG